MPPQPEKQKRIINNKNQIKNTSIIIDTILQGHLKLAMHNISLTFVFQRVQSVSVSVETGEESQGRILHIIIGPLVIMSLSSFQIHKDDE